ncbi:AAA family ATPase [Lactiplantibacillus plantarum]|uniref:AAA family ATPase n=1 Tax=Lactiplantibacillus plantarum TaxID=1590 RepID=UPI001BA89532|nr:AAA family ATPase [Lactiplantibacillus plantarum]MBS0945702.1 AAA family ATPase [Lactiplantibacillus plantarum]
MCLGNYKGGVGKTKNTVMIAYSLAKMGKKCLVLDLDPQGNATTVLVRTKQNQETGKVFNFEKTLMGAVQDENLSEVLVNIMPNLSLLPSYIDFANYSTFLDLKFGLVDSKNPNFSSIVDKKIKYLSSLVKPLEEKFDFIFFDVPPTKSYITDSAVMASDYVLIVLQTQELSLDGATQYLQDLQSLAETHGGNFEICGVLPVLMDGRASLDKLVLKHAAEVFGKGNIFDLKVPNMSRLKRFDNTGIQEKDQFDRKVLGFYKRVTNEFLKRISFFEEAK